MVTNVDGDAYQARFAEIQMTHDISRKDTSGMQLDGVLHIYGHMFFHSTYNPHNIKVI
jgi:hypothetical protein